MINDKDKLVETVDNTTEVIGTVFKGIVIWWAISALIGLGLLGGLAYVVWHFVSKVW